MTKSFPKAAANADAVPLPGAKAVEKKVNSESQAFVTGALPYRSELPKCSVLYKAAVLAYILLLLLLLLLMPLLSSWEQTSASKVHVSLNSVNRSTHCRYSCLTDDLRQHNQHSQSSKHTFTCHPDHCKLNPSVFALNRGLVRQPWSKFSSISACATYM